MDVGQIVVVCLLGTAANFVGVITGGSGIVTTGIMIALGIDPHNAVANTRFSVLGVDIAAISVFHREKRIAYRLGLPLSIASGITAAASAYMIPDISAEGLKRIIGACMLLLVLLTLIFRNIGVERRELRSGAGIWVLGVLLIIVATALTTVAGGAAGALYSYILVMVYGQTFLDSAGTRKIVALMLTMASMPMFILHGLVQFELACPLLFCNAVGGWLGAKFMIRRGEKMVKWIFLIGVTLMAVWFVVA